MSKQQPMPWENKQVKCIEDAYLYKIYKQTRKIMTISDLHKEKVETKASFVQRHTGVLGSLWQRIGRSRPNISGDGITGLKDCETMWSWGWRATWTNSASTSDLRGSSTLQVPRRDGFSTEYWQPILYYQEHTGFLSATAFFFFLNKVPLSKPLQIILFQKNEHSFFAVQKSCKDFCQ